MKIKITILVLFCALTTFKAQVNVNNIFTNEQALIIAKKDGYQTINVPILSRYIGITDSQADILQKLKLKSIIEYSVIDPTKKIIDTKITYTGNKFITGQTKQGNIIRTYLAVALIEVDKVNEVRQHQTKNNAQTVDFQFKILDNSNVGRALNWFNVGSTLTHTVDFINTSNGWKKDMSDRNDPSLTDYRSSPYGISGLKSYRKRIKDIEFVKNIKENILGKWNKSTAIEKRREHYIFNVDGTFEYYVARKDKLTKGKYKFDKNYGTQRNILLIPREGKNKYIKIQRSRSGFLIIGLFSNQLFKKEGSVNKIVNDKLDLENTSETNKRILNLKKKMFSERLPGFWKSSNGKVTLDIKSDSLLIFKNKKDEYKNSTYKLQIINDELFLVVFDEDLLEVFKEELKVVKGDYMVLDNKKYIKF